MGPGGVVLVVLWAAVLVGVTIVFALIGLAVNDFVVPIMWLRGCRVMAAWAELRALLDAHPGAFILYVLMKIVLGIGLVLIACLAACVTCCIAMLPYIGTVILLPLYVFRRSYSIHFLNQFGLDYAPLGPAKPQPSA